MNGSKTYYLPHTDIEVEVTYEIDGEDVVFQYAEIGGAELDCTALGVTTDDKEQMSLKSWFQLKLDRDCENILMDNDIVVRSDRDEHFNQGAFI